MLLFKCNNSKVLRFVANSSHPRFATSKKNPYSAKYNEFYDRERSYNESKLGDLTKLLFRFNKRLPLPSLEALVKRKPKEVKSFLPPELLEKRLQKAEQPETKDYIDWDGEKLEEGEPYDGNDGNTGLVENLQEVKKPIMHYSNPLDPNSWYVTAVGSRKRSVAKIQLTAGTGEITINKSPLSHYFPNARHKEAVVLPLLITDQLCKFDITCSVKGGGITGQAEAVRMSISRALQYHNPDLRPILKQAGYLERDQREVERKKPGQPKARKKFQWSKR